MPRWIAAQSTAGRAENGGRETLDAVLRYNLLELGVAYVKHLYSVLSHLGRSITESVVLAWSNLPVSCIVSPLDRDLQAHAHFSDVLHCLHGHFAPGTCTHFPQFSELGILPTRGIHPSAS